MLFFPEDARLYGFRHFKTSKQGETQCEILFSGLQWEWIAWLDSWGRGHGRCTVDRGFLSVRDLARVLQNSNNSVRQLGDLHLDAHAGQV